MDGKEHYFAVAIFIFLCGGFLGVYLNGPHKTKSTRFNMLSKKSQIIESNTAIDPIEISGNAELASHPKVKGNGTWAEPYIIENYDIINQSATSGIHISNTDKPLIIRNCIIECSDNGIYLDNVSNANINNSCMENHENYGIYLKNSKNTTIMDNTALKNEDGFYSVSSENNTFRGNNASKNTDDGFYISSSDNNKFRDNFASENDFNGFYLDLSHENNLTDNDAIANINEGIVLRESELNILTNNTVSGSIYAIELDEADNNQLIENTVTDNEYGIRIWGMHFENSDNNTLKNNIISDNDNYGVELYDSYNTTLTGNCFYSCGLGFAGEISEVISHDVDQSNTVNGKPLHFYKNQIELGQADFINPGQVILVNCTDSDISDLIISNTSDAILLLYSDENMLTNNTAFNNNEEGIYLYNSHENNLSDNTLYKNSHGIFLRGSNNNTVTDNEAENNIYDGLVLYYADYNNVTDNTFSENIYDGIFLYESWQNLITDNTISENINNGITLDTSVNNTLTSNTVSYNENYGAFLQEDAEINTLFLNYFMYNGLYNAKDDGYSNSWDNDSIGNYYSDYKGQDSDGDGICDEPYNIPGSANSQDDYPIYESQSNPLLSLILYPYLTQPNSKIPSYPWISLLAVILLTMVGLILVSLKRIFPSKNLAILCD
jgi:parallel beta-helix repeat protein